MNRLEQAKSAIALSALLVLGVAAFAFIEGLNSLWFAWIAPLCLLGLFDLLAPVVRIRLPNPLRRVRTCEARSRAYRSLGVPLYGLLLRRTPLRLLNRRVYLEDNPDWTRVASRMEDAEASHFWNGVATIPYLALAFYQGWWDCLVLTVLFDVLANLYPILHLRSVRARIQRAAHRRARAEVS